MEEENTVHYYSAEKNVLQLLALMKAHGVRKIVISPGGTNVCLVTSVQTDRYFELYSCVDERSAAYMACGLAEESGEPVAISCTGATASRNYYPALTEAFYRKLPILAITSTRSIGQIGQNIDQVTDRSRQANDVVVRSEYIPVPNTGDEEWENNVKINSALIDLRRHGGGPVHLNLMTRYTNDFSVKSLPQERVIRYYSYGDTLPSLMGGRVGIFVGAHKKWSKGLTEAVDAFCACYGAVVLTEPGSNYQGQYAVPYNLICSQKTDKKLKPFDVVIHLGETALFLFGHTGEIWRVNRDGRVRDTFRKLTNVFELEEETFFRQYVSLAAERKNRPACEDMAEAWRGRQAELEKKAETAPLPFSNVWIAQQCCRKLPAGCELHLGILNSARSWTYFTIEGRHDIFCNTGGYGIDGGLSTLTGASLVDPGKLYFGIVGDLAFFYDMNALGNRHIGKNLRLMIIHNGLGGEFKLKSKLPQRAGLGDEADPFIAASGHFGNQSRELVKGYAAALGFTYLTADSKESFREQMERFFSDEIRESIVFEVFTSNRDDAQAVQMMETLEPENTNKAKEKIKRVLGEKNVQTIKRVIRG